MVSQTPNFNMKNNKIISQTVHNDSTHKKIDKNSRSLNIKINSSANLVNNHELVSKLDKINLNTHNTCFVTNVNKSYKNFNEICILKEKYDQLKNKSENNAYNMHNKASKNIYKFSTNYNNYKIIKPQKKNIINYNKSFQYIKSETNKGNLNHKKSYDFDKPLKNIHFSQNQQNEIIENNKGHSSLKGKNLNHQSYKNEKFNNQWSCNSGNKKFNDLDLNSNSSVSKSPILTIQDINNLNNIENESSNFNFAELNNKPKLSRNDKKNGISNLFLNTVNNPNYLGKINLPNQHNPNKNDNNFIFMDSNSKLNNKSVESIKNLYLGINQHSLTCVNKDQKRIKYEANHGEPQKERFLNSNQNKEIKKPINIVGFFNNKSNSDLFNELVIHSDSSKNNNTKTPTNDYKKLQNVNKISTLNLYPNENCNSKKTLLNTNKRNENSNFSCLNSHHNHTSVNIISETHSSKKVLKESKFKY